MHKEVQLDPMYQADRLWVFVHGYVSNIRRQSAWHRVLTQDKYSLNKWINIEESAVWLYTGKNGFSIQIIVTYTRGSSSILIMHWCLQVCGITGKAKKKKIQIKKFIHIYLKQKLLGNSQYSLVKNTLYQKNLISAVKDLRYCIGAIYSYSKMWQSNVEQCISWANFLKCLTAPLESDRFTLH